MGSKKSQQNSDKFWRKQVHSPVVDLRILAKKQSEPTKRQVKAQKQQNSSVKKPAKNDLREQIYQDLHKFDSQDIVLQKFAAPAPSDEQQRAASAGLQHTSVTPARPSRGSAAQAEDLKIKRAEINLIPKNPTALKDISVVDKAEKTSKKREKELREQILRGDSKKRGFKKIAVGTLLLLLVLGIPILTFRAMAFKQEVPQLTATAYEHMQKGRDALIALNPQEAKSNFLAAQEQINKIENGLNIFSFDFVAVAARFPVQNKLSSAVNLVRAGKFFTNAGISASNALGVLQGIEDITASDINSGNYLTDNIIEAASALASARENLQAANHELTRIRAEDVPDRFSTDLLSIQRQTAEIEDILKSAFSSVDVLLEFLGHSSERNYLLIFQNSSELRPTGGFIGTYGVLRLNKGHIDKLFMDGIYNPDRQMSVNVIPPKPLQYVTPDWGMRDANWFFDFPTSAKKFMWFHSKTSSLVEETALDGKVAADGVIAITPRVIQNLLELVGPIEMPEYGISLDQNNFLEIIQEEVEQNYDKELNAPKQILSDLAPMLIEKVQKYDNKMALIDILIQGLDQKDIQIYSRDKSVQNFVQNRNWGGEIIARKGLGADINDYLAVVFSNIGGWKTDEYTNTEIDTVTSVNSEGEIYRTVIISRTHNGGNTPYLWYNKPNYGYIKIYTPLGSEYVSADGFSAEPTYIKTDYGAEGYVEDSDLADVRTTLRKNPETGTEVFAESARTVFGNWLWIPAGQRRIAQLTYKLPFTVDNLTSSYGLLIQKQSGISASYSGEVEEFKADLRVSNCSLDGASLGGTSFNFIQTVDTQIICKLK